MIDSFAAAAAARLLAARASCQTLDLLLSEQTPLSLGDAYAIQDAMTALRLSAGETVVGWKLGYTSTAMRQQMGISEPNRGPLLSSMLLPNGGEIPDNALQPRVEPEIGLKLARPVTPGAGVEEVLDCCAAALACLEVVDSIWTGYRFTLADNTADGSSAAWVVVGPAVPLDDLADLTVRLQVGSGPVTKATGSDAGGHPALGVAWLARQLADHPRGLREGDLVITGGLTAAAPLAQGDIAHATFSAAPCSAAPCSVSVRRSRRGPEPPHPPIRR